MSSLCHTQNTGSPWNYPTLRGSGSLQRATEGHQAKEMVWELEAWGEASFCSAKRNEGLEALIKLAIFQRLYGECRDALFTRINGDRTRGNRHKFLQEEIHTGIRKNSSS